MNIHLKQAAKRAFSAKTNISLVTLRKWQVVLAVVFAVQAALIWILGARYDRPVTISYLTTDSLQSKLTGQTVLAQAVHQLLMLNVATMAALVLAVMSLAYALSVTSFRTRYEATIKTGIHTVRWVSYAASGALMAIVLALLIGMYDLSTLLFVGALVAMLYLTGMVFEQSTAARRISPATRMSAGIGICAGIVVGIGIAIYVVAASTYGYVHFSGYVYALLGVVALLVASQGTIAYLIALKKGKWGSYIYGDCWYMVIDFVLKTAFAWLVYAAVMRG